MSPLPGAVLLLLGLLAGLVATHVGGRRYFDRPALARRAWFDPLLAAMRWTLLAAGLVLLARASSVAGAAAVAGLLLLWGATAYAASAAMQVRSLRRELAARQRQHPGRTDAEILFDIACARYPRWGPELIEQIVRDHPTVEGLGRVFARMERGFRGFGSGRRRPRRYWRGRPGS